MTKPFSKIVALTALAATPITSFALPIDWHGSFGVDTTVLSNYKRVKSNSNGAIDPGSQEVKTANGGKESASFQSYILKLAPTLIINDAATFKAELTTGYGNGGFLGDSAQADANGSNTASNFHYNEARGNEVSIRKAYAEIYADTATFLVGRHSAHWGLGAIYNDGANTWDRHSSSRDGVTMKLKLGNFFMSPFWSKVHNSGLTNQTNAKEYGAALLYDNKERDIAFGLNYTVKKANAANTYYQTQMENETTPRDTGAADVEIIDLYFGKTWGKFDVALELPLISGDIGTTAAGDKRSYSAKAALIETNYRHNDAWTIGVDAGQVAGHDGSVTKYGAIYLNPNYQVANLLFRYNMAAIGNDTKDALYDSYISNSRYLKLRSSYSTEKWIFDTAIVYAQAIEVAKTGKSSYNHTTNRLFTANANQSKDLGTEIDINATYKWNKEIAVGVNLGYLMTGDYFKFTNDPAVNNETKNSLLLQFHTSVTF